MPAMPQRLALGSLLALACFGVLSSTLACQTDKPANEADTAGKTEPATKTADGDAGAEAGKAPDEGAAAAATSTTGAAEPAGTTSTTGEVAPPPEPVDPVPALLETAKNPKTSVDDAIKALDEAKAAGADKIELAKLANTRGDELLKKEKPEDAETFWTWAKDTHELYAEPVFALAKQSCLVGDADLCKELLLEVKKRGNKKLLKQVGTDPIFIIVADDSEIRKLYEK